MAGKRPAMVLKPVVKALVQYALYSALPAIATAKNLWYTVWREIGNQSPGLTGSERSGESMKKWKVILFLAGWLVLGFLVTAVNGLGESAHGEHAPAATSVETTS